MDIGRLLTTGIGKMCASLFFNKKEKSSEKLILSN